MTLAPWVGLFLGLDLVSCALALAVAAFFFRAHRLLPGEGHDVLALAFGILGLAYLPIAASVFRVLDLPLVDALRVGGQFLAVLLLFVHYAARRVRLPMRTLHTLVAALCVLALGYLALNFAPAAGIPPPLALLPGLRFVEFLLLLAAAYFVSADVQGRTLSDYQVPLAFLLLGVGKYSVALLEMHGVEGAVVFPYLWRLAGLALLLRVVWPAKGWPRAPT